MTDLTPAARAFVTEIESLLASFPDYAQDAVSPPRDFGAAYRFNDDQKGVQIRFTIVVSLFATCLYHERRRGTDADTLFSGLSSVVASLLENAAAPFSGPHKVEEIAATALDRIRHGRAEEVVRVTPIERMSS